MNRLHHLAIIMDGNGRWATQRGQKRIKGHEEGVNRVREMTIYAADHEEIDVLTLYAFSTENWKRPQLEVNFLMRLLSTFLKKEMPTYLEHEVRFETIGDLSSFSPQLQKQIEKTKAATRHFSKLAQVLALNYGSQDELARTAASLCVQNIPITPETIEQSLDTAPFGPVDLLIRTGGDHRLSNFLLWQAAYAELYFTPTFWPDFKVPDLETAISEYKRRQRRFGGL